MEECGVMGSLGKQRMRWSPEMRECFERAVNHLGGPDSEKQKFHLFCSNLLLFMNARLVFVEITQTLQNPCLIPILHLLSCCIVRCG